MKIKVVGMGGIGTCLIHPLARFLNYTKFPAPVQLTIIDGDQYEEKNKDRQWFSELGNKAEVTVKTIAPMYAKINFFSAALFISADNVVRSIREGDCIFLCVDNDKTRKIIADRCKDLQEITVINGGNELISGTVQTWVKRKGKNLTLPIDNETYGFKIAKAADEHPKDVLARNGCEVRFASGETQTIIVNNAVAAAMLNALYALLQGQLDYDIVYVDCLPNRMASRKNNTRPELVL